MNYIFDTSILIDHLRGGKTFNKISLELPDDFHLIISAASIIELFSGKSTRKKEVEEEVRELISNFEIKDIDKKISKRAGVLVRDSKISIGLADNIIAATAVEIGAQVVTLNKKHFSSIPQVVLYS
jgi:predicted nucleic acid-binding protein